MAEGQQNDAFRTLDSIGRRDERKVGRKARILARLAAAGMPVPPGWVIERKYFDAMCEGALPRKHDLRSLIREAGTRVGDERCARAYEEILAAPIDEALREALAGLWETELSRLPGGVAVRPSLATSGGRPGSAGLHLHSRLAVRSLEELIEAVRNVWASSTLSWAVAGYASAEHRDVSVAVILQTTVEAEAQGLITRTINPVDRVAEADWHLGVSLRSEGKFARRGQLLVPLAQGRGGAEPPAPLARLRAVLQADGFERLIELGAVGVEELGLGAVLHFAVSPRTEGEVALHVLNADEGPRWAPLPGGDETTTWAELTLGGRSPEPPSRLTQSVLERAVRASLDHALERFDCALDDDSPAVVPFSGRSYVDLDAIVDAVRDVPLARPEEILSALGGIGADARGELAGRAASRGRSLMRAPWIWSAALRSQATLDADLSAGERALERELRGLADLELAILPNDAMATTLAAAQSSLERAMELWATSAAALLATHFALHALLRRHLDEVAPLVGHALAAGRGDGLATTLADHVVQTLREVERDPEAVAQLRGGVQSVDDLPSGPSRSSVKQLVNRYSDFCLGPFELSRPRWGENAEELLAMMGLLATVDTERVEQRIRRARSIADAELARYEPTLPPLERRAFRALIDRSKAVLRRRTYLDRLVLRALAGLRRVARDVERRLRRLDPDMPPGGPFHCSAGRLRASLKSGRPELARVIRMRTVEREKQAREPAPPLGFVGSAPRGGIPIVPRDVLRGVGVSPGVVEGRVRRIVGALPRALAPGDILVGTTFDLMHAPLGLVAEGVIAEGGGLLAPGADALRELAVPAVFAVAHAMLLLQEGERVRIDGTLGTVHRLEVERESPWSVRSARAPSSDDGPRGETT